MAHFFSSVNSIPLGTNRMAPEKKDSVRPDAEAAPPETPMPHPSFIQVAKPYVFEQTIQDCITALGVDPLREEGLRLQGVAWIDSVRRALHLPVRTFNTAVVYYHKFRLVHADNEYNYMDAAAAALFTACKIEDTLKKSREIVCTAFNLKLPPAEHLSPDDPLFEVHARGIIGLERLMLEANGFDFRSRHPQNRLVKLAKSYGVQKDSEVASISYRISIDLYRTFAPIKQTTTTMAFASLELAGRLLDDRLEDVESGRDYEKWKTSREEVMETLLDLLELYTHHRGSTSVGPSFPVDKFLTIRIPLNQEVDAKKLPRYTNWRNGETNGSRDGKDPAAKNVPTQNPLTPISATGERPKPGGRDGTVRFMLDPERAQDEKAIVSEYFKNEMEEYEIEE
ncbi:hypothetical protein DTO280E4_1668 [Paecilomyces variotii]|nr:hypothetical protein DTO280E4_1668 [Paecilomyces variotii]